MDIAEKYTLLTTEKIPGVYNSGGLSQCPKKIVSGEELYLTDISPIEHNMAVKLESKNLVKLPTEIKSIGGIDAIINDDGSITFNGTATKRASLGIDLDIVLEIGETYIISGCVGGSESRYKLFLQTNNYKQSQTITNSPLTLTANYHSYYLTFIVESGVTVENVVVKPMIEKGTKATPYTPFVEDVSTVKLDALGKNLFNNDNSLISEQTYTISNGAKETRVGYVLELPKGTYTFSLKELDSSSKYIYGSINDKDGNFLSKCNLFANTNNYTPLTVTVNDGDKIYIYNGTNSTISATTQLFNSTQIQLEVGKTATDFESYIEPTSYTPNADGTVEGVKSIYPTTILTTDTSGVLIECEYYQNPQKTGETIGKQAEYDAFWDEFQNYGNRTNYSYFGGECWNDKTFKPKYDINLKGYSAYFGADMSVTDMSKILSDCGVVLNTANAVNFTSMFYMADVTKLPALDLSKATNLDYCIYACLSLKEIEKIIVTEKQTFPSSFLWSKSLERVIFEGTIASTITLTYCTLLSKESIESIISCLSTTATGQTLTLSLTAVNNAFETSAGAADGSTSEEWINLITPKSNSYNGLWTITLV